MHLSGFEIGDEIGGAGDRRIRRARRPHDGRRVLLKASNDSGGATAHARAILERELEIGRELEVDGVLLPLELVDSDRGPVLVLADAPGVTLDRVLGRRGGTLPLAAASASGSPAP